MARLFSTSSNAKGGNIYEVNIRQYTPEGTFAAFQQHLSRLQEMGVEILWLMPVTPISIEKRQGTLGSYYACSSYTDVNPEFGRPADLKALVAEAHERGMQLIIDWVANHTGWDHHWKTEHPEWYQKNEAGEFYDKNGWIDVIDLDFDREEMRREMIRCMQYWVREYDIDGFRCDMAHLVPLEFWMEARIACDEIKPLFWLAETDDVLYHDVFDATYAWSWMHASELFFKGQTGIETFKAELSKFNDLPDDCCKLLFTTNHDENSWNGTEYEKYGNAAKALAVLCCTYKAMPLMYSGQELPNLKRLLFFDRDHIDWTERPALHSFYTSLLQLRRKSKAVRSGTAEILSKNEADKVFAFIRIYEGDVVLVILNLSGAERINMKLHHGSLMGKFQSLFSGLTYQFDKDVVFELDPWGYLVYVLQA